MISLVFKNFWKQWLSVCVERETIAMTTTLSCQSASKVVYAKSSACTGKGRRVSREGFERKKGAESDWVTAPYCGIHAGNQQVPVEKPCPTRIGHRHQCSTYRVCERERTKLRLGFERQKRIPKGWPNFHLVQAAAEAVSSRLCSPVAATNSIPVHL